MTPAEPLPPLHDILLPEGVSLWPLAPGWWLLLGIGAAAMGTAFFLWRRRGWLRRAALNELASLRRRCGDEDPACFAAKLSPLLRRVALARFPRREVAALYGEAWLRFLDHSGHTDAFTRGPGQALAEAPYRGGDQIDIQALERIARDWITEVC